jgi:hypothetical protein
VTKFVFSASKSCPHGFNFQRVEASVIDLRWQLESDEQIAGPRFNIQISPHSGSARAPELIRRLIQSSSMVMFKDVDSWST